MTKISVLMLLYVLCVSYLHAQTNTFPSTGAAGIGTITPDASSLLEIKSTTKGMLVPRMTQAQRNAIVTPATGLLIYQTTNSPGFYYYSGTAWTAVSPKGVNKSLSNLTAPTALNQSLLPGTNNTLDLGSPALAWRNGYFAGNVGIGTSSPAGMLHVKGNTNVSQLIIDANSTQSNTNPLIRLRKSDGTDLMWMHSDDATNSFVGLNAGKVNNAASGGVYNTFIGSKAGYSNTTGGGNSANGFQALYSNTKGNYNTANGYQALFSDTTGNYNTANGVQALFSNIKGNSNTANGLSALFSNKAGNNGVAIGYSSQSNVNNTTISWDNTNTSVGYQSLMGSVNPANNTGVANTAIGRDALISNTAGSWNTASGYQALFSNTTGFSNVAVGAGALYKNTDRSNLVAIGDSALYNNGIGVYSEDMATGNTAVGSKALFTNTAGSRNTANGSFALYSNFEGFNNTALGWHADVFADYYNATAIGFTAIVDAVNKVRVGNTYVTSIGGQVGWTTFSDGRYKKNIKEDVQGLAFINSLKPITYTVDINSLNEYFDKGRKHDSAYEKMKKDMQPSADEASKIVYNGFIAQDVEKAAQSIGYNFSGVDKPKTKDGLYGLRYGDFVVPLVKAVQELSVANNAKDAKIEEQDKKIDAQQQMISNLISRLDKLEQSITTLQQCSPCNAAGATAQTYNTVITDGAALEQNVPNPFTHNTSIGYTLPQKYTTAQIMITDKSGKTLKLVNVSGSGKGNLIVDASVLASGAYNYSLLIDGKLIGTKQMEHIN